MKTKHTRIREGCRKKFRENDENCICGLSSGHIYVDFCPECKARIEGYQTGKSSAQTEIKMWEKSNMDAQKEIERLKQDEIKFLEIVVLFLNRQGLIGTQILREDIEDRIVKLKENK